MRDIIAAAFRDIGNAEFHHQSVQAFESILREAADRLEFEMKDVLHDHVQATNRVKGEIVPKADSRGNPLFYESGKPRNQRLVIRYELRCERRKPGRDGLTFPNLYWARRKGSPLIVKKGPNPGKKITPADRMPVPDGHPSYSIGTFRSANPVELRLIEATETNATDLRLKARFYAGLWAAIRAHKMTKHYREHVEQLLLR